MPEFDTRVGAYGVIVDAGKILLAHWNARGSANWTLPGGGMEAGESAEVAACREILEETGYQVQLEGLLGVDSQHFPAKPPRRPFHSFRVIYQCRIVGGGLRNEVDGTTDEARWFDLIEVESLTRVSLVDAGLRLWNEKNGNEMAPATRLSR